MSIKPQIFFIGVINFFSVLLPGVLLTYLLMGVLYDDVFGKEKIFPEPSFEAVKWIISSVITYILGNIIYAIVTFLDFSFKKNTKKIC